MCMLPATAVMLHFKIIAASFCATRTRAYEIDDELFIRAKNGVTGYLTLTVSVRLIVALHFDSSNNYIHNMTKRPNDV